MSVNTYELKIAIEDVQKALDWLMKAELRAQKVGHPAGYAVDEIRKARKRLNHLLVWLSDLHWEYIGEENAK